MLILSKFKMIKCRQKNQIHVDNWETLERSLGLYFIYLSDFFSTVVKRIEEKIASFDVFLSATVFKNRKCEEGLRPREQPDYRNNHIHSEKKTGFVIRSSCGTYTQTIRSPSLRRKLKVEQSIVSKSHVNSCSLDFSNLYVAINLARGATFFKMAYVLFLSTELCKITNKLSAFQLHSFL